jgi:3-methyladenine DNA glycosylase AlkD
MSDRGERVIKRLRGMSNDDNVRGMARYGIATAGTLGISMPEIRRMAKELGKDHELALELWKSKIHEARILAALIAEPKRMTRRTMELWVKDFDSWDVCDQVVSNLFDKTSVAYELAFVWSVREEEYVRRAGYVMMAALAVHDKLASDRAFLEFLPVIVAGANDNRNFVRKAVNWALRQIGKRNLSLNQAAISCAQEIAGLDSNSAKWIAADALRELKDPKIQERLANKSKKRNK